MTLTLTKTMIDSRLATFVAAALVATVAVALLAPNAALAFPSGAPEAACKDLKPGHGGEPASGAAPFELTQDKLQAEAGDQIKGKYKERTEKEVCQLANLLACLFDCLQKSRRAC